jgi:acyl-coenzyme A synthetase/AMP-(fatty) acid ligase
MLSLSDQEALAPCPTPFNLAGHVLALGAKTPDKTALEIVGMSATERWSFADLKAAILGCGTGLLALGVRRGDCILLRLGNEAAFPIAFLGAVAAGIIPVPTSAQLTSAEVDRLVSTLAPSLIIEGEGVALPTATSCPRIRAENIIEMAKLPPCAFDLGDPERLAYLIFTSGTSGTPRAVMHAHRAIWARNMIRRDWSELTSDDRVLHSGALNWTYTLGAGLLDPWITGATALVPAADVEPADLPTLLQRHKVTVFASAPGIFRRMLKAPLPKLPHLRHALSAGEKLPEHVRDDWRYATGTEVFESFGMSEVSNFISASAGRPAPPGAIGYPQRGRRVAVLGPDGAIVRRGSDGILAVARGDPGLFLGYLGAELETMGRPSGDWFMTGDIVRITDDGAVEYLGRADDMMNAGGNRVSPAEVEAAMTLFPGLRECAATEVTVKPDVTVVACFYVSNAPIADAELSAHAALHLARYKQPRLFIRVPALPRDANSKLRRRPLRFEWENQNHAS